MLHACYMKAVAINVKLIVIKVAQFKQITYLTSIQDTNSL
jgi:hypothetical protein